MGSASLKKSVPAEPDWKLPLILFVIAHLVGTIHSTAITVMVPVIKDYYQVPYTAVAALITWYSIGQAVSSIPNGTIIDRIGVRNGLLFGFSILLLAAVLISLARNIFIAYVALFMMGWGYSAINPATSKGVFLCFTANRRATAMGIKQTGVPLGGIIAGLVGGLAVAHNVEVSGWNLQWQTIMLLIAAITFVGIGLCLILPKSLNEAKETANQTSIANELKILASDWQFNRYALATLALNFGQYNFFTFLTAFLTKVLSFAQEAAGSVYSVVQAASAFARPFWGFASDFFLHSRKKALCAIICFIAVLCFVACALISYAGAPAWFGISVSIILGITIASYPPLIQAITVEAVKPNKIGSALGYTHMAMHTGACLGPLAMGITLDLFNYSVGYGLTAAVVLMGVLLLTFGFKEETGVKRRKPAKPSR